MDAGTKFNLRNPAVKRILQEIKEMQNDNALEFVAEALEDNIFEWHFVIRGPPDTEFEGGIYHGRILLPTEYPFKPPSFVMLTPSGRFEVGKKICLSISERHPEHWQPSWSMRTALMALVAFLPTKGKGAIGSLDYPENDRRVLAQKSRTFIPTFPNKDRQEVATIVHNVALQRESEAASKQSGSTTKTTKNVKQGELVDAANCVTQDAHDTIMTAADVQLQSSSSSEEANPPEKDETQEKVFVESRRNQSSESIVNSAGHTDWLGSPGTAHGEMDLEVGGDREWLWSAGMWTVGSMIVALVAKRVLVMAGVDVWSYNE